MDPKQFTHQKPGRVIQTQTAYWAFLPSPLPPEFAWSTMLVSILAEAERELGRLSSLADGFPFPRLLIQPFIRNEAVLSSRIEGTKASLVDLYRYETTQLSFFEQTNDVKEVFNYVQAMDYGLERLKTFPVSLRLIREIYAKLLQDVRGGNLSPGEFRRTQNWIGPAGSTPTSAPYVPPPVEEMYIALNALEKFIHSNSKCHLFLYIEGLVTKRSGSRTGSRKHLYLGWKFLCPGCY
jgi:Fic family protein